MLVAKARNQNMSAAEWFAPDEPTTLDQSAEELTWFRQDWVPRFSAWLRTTASTRPSDGGEDERAVLVDFVRLFTEFVRHVRGTAWLARVQSGLTRDFSTVVRRELSSTETEYKLSLHHLAMAVDRFGTFFELVRRSIQEAQSEALGLLLDEALKGTVEGTVKLHANDYVVLRFTLDVVVALEVLEKPDQDLAWWAQHALVSSRQVEAWMLREGARNLQGELVRLRARHAWDNWTEEDLAKELAPWPTTPPHGSQ